MLLLFFYIVINADDKGYLECLRVTTDGEILTKSNSSKKIAYDKTKDLRKRKNENEKNKKSNEKKRSKIKNELEAVFEDLNESEMEKEEEENKEDAARIKRNRNIIDDSEASTSKANQV